MEITHESVDNTAAGYGEAIDLLDAHSVGQVGVEGSAKCCAHIAIALAAAGFDAREVPASRSAAHRRSRRLDKTDAVDAVASARALLAESTLGPVQTLEVYDPLVAKIEAVLEHRRTLVTACISMLHHVADQISKLPTEVRDQFTTNGKIESRLRRLEHIDPDTCTTPAGRRRVEWLQNLIDQDRAARSEVRRLERLIDDLLDRHGTTLRDEPGVGPIVAANLLCEVGDPAQFDRESKFARWCGTGAVALSSGEGNSGPVKHRLGFKSNRRINSVLHIAPTTQQRTQPQAVAYPARKPQKARPDAKPDEPTNANSPTRQPLNVARRKSTKPATRALRLATGHQPTQMSAAYVRSTPRITGAPFRMKAEVDNLWSSTACSSSYERSNVRPRNRTSDTDSYHSLGVSRKRCPEMNQVHGT